MPISRVRSFTVISMMFMMTMPPTTMPIATTAGMAVKSRRVSLLPERDQGVGLVHGEVVGLAGPEPVGDAHRLLRPRHGPVDRLARSAS